MAVQIVFRAKEVNEAIPNHISSMVNFSSFTKDLLGITMSEMSIVYSISTSRSEQQFVGLA